MLVLCNSHGYLVLCILFGILTNTIVDETIGSIIGDCNPDLGRFLCTNANECIEAAKVCNRVPDCTDGSDEFVDCDKSCKGVRCQHRCIPNLDHTKPEKCYCQEGYTIFGSNRDRCRNINECNIWDSCSQLCDDREGSFRCSCLQVFELGRDNRSCTPINN